MRYALMLVGLLVGACGGDGGGLEPEPPFPDAAGVYSIDGRFDGVPQNQLSFDGTLTLTQSSRESGRLAGEISVTLRVPPNIATVQSDLTNASVSPDRDLTFNVADFSGSWTFSGRLTGGAIGGGRHTLSTSELGLRSGTWEGTKR